MNRPIDRLLGTRWWSWQRLACLAFTAALVAFLFRRIDPAALHHSLAQVRWSWFAAAFALYGLALLLGGLRWHVALHAIRCAVHVGASLRLAFIGHFLFVMFFGAAAGDVAKAALYARWYRFGIPELAASTPLDRALGFLAALAVGGAALLVGFFSGGFESLRRLELHLPTLWLVVTGIAVLAAGGALLLWKPASGSGWGRAWHTLRLGFHNFLSSRRQSMLGLFLAIAAQLALSGVFACLVRAVAGDSLPWLQLAWTFPVIMMLSCLPITVAGAGVREMLSLAFLGLYGVPAADCVGAAVLTFLCKITWGLIGGALLCREGAVQERAASKIAHEDKTISIIIPALNEADALPITVQHLRQNDSIHEIIVVDGGSTDRTPEIAEQLGCRVLTSPPGRGGQMRAGAAAATGDVILLLHADTWLPPHATRALLDCLRDGAVVGGGFWKEFREPPLLLRGSTWKCAVRLWVGRRVAGDQGLFIRRAVLERIGGVPDLPLMEEFALSRLLQREGRLALADALALTSARRFRKLGVIRTYLRMWFVTMRYRAGVSPAELRKQYEK